MRRITGRGLPVLLAALLAACNNPFFSGLLDKGGKETPGPAVYTVTFDKNGGDTDAVPATKTVTGPATTIDELPAQPSRSGYDFTGWNTEAGGSGTGFTASTTVSGDITVYAQWQNLSDSYTVDFMLNDGTETVHAVKTVTVPATAIGAADFPANPARSGYDFAGWNTEAGGSGTEFTASTTVSGNITVYAKWQEILPGSYTVTFKMNDGTETVHGIKTVTPPATTVTDFPADPIRTGYAFGSWYTARDGGGTAFTASTTVSADITVYALWTGETYTVTFDNDGGDTAASPATKTVTRPAATIDSLPAQPSKTGYSFGGWYTARNGGGTEFTASTTVSGNITVYALWTGETYTVSFDHDGGDTAANPATKIVTRPATTIDSLPAQPSKTGYSFGGWYTARNGGGTEFTASTTVSGNITVYALWTAIPVDAHTVTFALNDGTEPEGIHAVKSVTSPATTITDFPADPVRTGYAFGGWYTERDGGGTAFTASTTVSGDRTVYAKWNTYSYTVSFDDGAGNMVTRTVSSPAAVIDPLPAAPPDKTGYSFGGWYTEPDGGGTEFTISTTVSGNITVYARWIGRTYTVSFDNDGGDTEADPATSAVTRPATTTGELPAPPAKTGYIFGGWYTDRDGGGTEFTAWTAVNNDIRVYAKWDTYSYTVSFDNDGGTTEANPATKTVASPATTVVSLPVPPAKTGYNFGGWYTELDGGGSEFTASTTVSGSITVYARWDAYSYTVSFDTNGGDTQAEPATKTVATPATTIDTLPAPPAKTDYFFAGWNTQANGSGTPFTALTTVSGDITVYALWGQQSGITLNLDAGEGAFTQASFTLSKSATESQSLTLTGTGYTNPRWYVDDNLKGTDNSVTINAADYGAGGHSLALIISKDGVSWSKEIGFTVTN
jgi:uncharacterized repeat protein (TIGR02543 family)